MKKHRIGTCAYCGLVTEVTKDHVPPKNLFPKPRPKDLIYVPGCPACHSISTSKDDEYFRNTICLREETSGHPAAKAIQKTVLRSLMSSDAPGLRKQLVLDMRWVDLMTVSGLYLGRRRGFNVDIIRIRRVVARIVRGLYFVEVGVPLGLRNEVRVYDEADVTQQPKNVVSEFTRVIIRPIMAIPPKSVGNGIFLYRHKIVENNPSFSVWGVSFYGKVAFVAMTKPPTHRSSDEAQKHQLDPPRICYLRVSKGTIILHARSYQNSLCP